MKITNCGRGIHQREISGLDKLRRLPPEWMAFTNLELALPQGGREIDVILILNDRVLLVDLKDWKGKITSQDGAWYNAGRRVDRSPVSKIMENAKEVAWLLKSYYKEQSRRPDIKRSLVAPRIEGVVVLTRTKDKSGIAPTEVDRVYAIDEFVRVVQDVPRRIERLGAARPEIVSDPLTTTENKALLGRFFNVTTGPFRPGTRIYAGFRATSDTPCFRGPPSEVFAEYDVEEADNPRVSGILRKWDFTKAETRFQTEAARREVAGRERDVIAWLNDRNVECESSILQPRVDDVEKGVDYWEIFEKRRRLKRLSEFARVEADRLSKAERVEMARQVIDRARLLHSLGAAHLDLGAHSIWLERPSTVRLSHFMAASYPEVESLGERRYQFLSSVQLPEDAFGEPGAACRKDVFLLGCAVHELLFGAPPSSAADGEPPDWLERIDELGEFEEFYPWFAKALSWDPKDRFSDGVAALEAFNGTWQPNSLDKTVFAELEAFNTIRSFLQLIGEFPVQRTIRDDDQKALWISEREGSQVLVKVWKRACWDDDQREAPRILDFLNRAYEISQSPLPACVSISRVVWLGDAIVIVQDWVEAPDLAQVCKQTGFWDEGEHALNFLKNLAKRVDSFHGRGFTHGDLKPENILVFGDQRDEPLFVDFLEFAAAVDGEVYSSAYAPAEGGPAERDRYAVTVIVEEVLEQLSLDGNRTRTIHEAIHGCRESPPKNGTLLPLIEALELSVSPSVDQDVPEYVISLIGAEPGPLLADEGLLGLRRAPDKPILFIRGACEQLQINFDKRGRPYRGRRQVVDQRRIQAVSRYEFAHVRARLDIVDRGSNDFGDVEKLLQVPEIAEQWASLESGTVREESPDELIDEVASDYAADQLAGRLEAEPSGGLINVPLVWRLLLDIEDDLSIEGTAAADSSFKPELRRHRVPFQLESGVFDFAKEDTVFVERMNKRGQWRKWGRLDVSTSRSDQLFIEFFQPSLKDGQPIVSEGERLRFDSHFETVSRTRRNEATTRILARDSANRNLIDVFDTRNPAAPHLVGEEVSGDEFRNRYGLNKVQGDALADILRCRPVGLLQGPPGTGKTRFIGALIHHVLTSGMAKNVLLASQSHEAVNGAAEAVLKQFEGQDAVPSILRVGHEGSVSEPLLPYHVARVEQLYKDRFRAEFKERVRVATQGLGLNDPLIDDVLMVENTIRPVVDRIVALEGESGEEASQRRLLGLRTTLENQIGGIGIGLGDALPTDVSEVPAWLIREIELKHDVSNPAHISRVQEVVRLIKDIIGAVSGRQRSMETFLAGTRQIVAGTCVGLGRSSLGLTETPFDLVVVDEAARCTASELSVPVQAGRWVVLVGDHAQLQPMHPEHVLEQVATRAAAPLREIVKSDFERVFDSTYGTLAGKRLTTQYRMLPPIGRIVSKAFYGGKLLPGRETQEIPSESLPSDLQVPLLWVSTDALGEIAFQQRSGKKGTSLINQHEADAVIALLKRWSDEPALRHWLEAQSEFSKPVGIICTYAAQRDLIRQKLRTANLNQVLVRSLNVDTVDGYQGKENPIVILSLVRNNAEGPIEEGSATIEPGFMSRPNRINVAMSRAMDRLIIVGARHRWPRRTPLGAVVSHFVEELDADEAREISAVDLIEAVSRDGRRSSKTKHRPMEA